MRLLQLPDVGYTYIFIEYNGGTKLTCKNLENLYSAQFWVDVELDEDKYSLAVWWKFWKPAITFKVFACGGTVDPFYQTVKLQEK